MRAVLARARGGARGSEAALAGAAHRGGAARPHQERGARDGRRRSSALRDLNRQLFSTPQGFHVHRKLKPQREKRYEVGPDDPIDWGHAESLAFASLLMDGVPIRLTGQDSLRGTFSQRHLVLVRRRDRRALRADPAPRRTRRRRSSSTTARCRRPARSGSSTATAPPRQDALVLWEAQFGDFVNAAQVIIDQFLVSGLAKWGEDVEPDPAPAARLRGRRARALERARASAS